MKDSWNKPWFSLDVEGFLWSNQDLVPYGDILKQKQRAKGGVPHWSGCKVHSGDVFLLMFVSISMVNSVEDIYILQMPFIYDTRVYWEQIPYTLNYSTCHHCLESQTHWFIRWNSFRLADQSWMLLPKTRVMFGDSTPVLQKRFRF